MANWSIYIEKSLAPDNVGGGNCWDDSVEEFCVSNEDDRHGKAQVAVIFSQVEKLERHHQVIL